MKSTLLIILLCVQTSVFGHDYFFSFAEVEYNPFTQKFETTLIVSAHDLEYVWKDSDLSVDSLENYAPESSAMTKVNTFLSQSFKISTNGKDAQFSVVGVDVLLNGMIHFYILSRPIEIGSFLDVQFDLLMDEFSEQQNKITYMNKGRALVASFLPNQRIQRINLEN